MNLQEEINTAVSGAVITLPDNSEHVGAFVVDKPLTIQGKAIIRTPNADPAVRIVPRTGPVSLKGKTLNEPLQITTTPGWAQVFSIVDFGGGQITNPADVPQGLALEFADVYGQVDQEVQRGIAANGANFSIKQSKVREIHGRGYDTQAICSWNGPGPFVIEDCFLEAAGENVMFGGSPASIPNLIPTDIIFRRNHCFKPLSWYASDPSFAGRRWSVKNLFELKNARRVLIDGNIFDGNWTDAQAGRAIVFTPRPSDSGSWAVIEDVEFKNNIVRNVGSGMLLLGADEPPAPTETRLKRVKVTNNVFIVDGPRFGSNGFFLTVIHKTEDVTVEHNTAIQTGNIIGSDYDPNIRFIYRNNISRHNEYGIFGGGIGNAAIANYFPGGVVTGNVMAKEVNAPSNVESLYPAGNYFPANLDAIGFVDRANGNYRLSASSVYKGRGTDGRDPGCDMDALEAALGGTAPPEPVPQPPPVVVPPPTPTTSPDGTKAVEIVDAEGNRWTIGPEHETLRNGVKIGGAGVIYKWLGGVVYVLTTDNRTWYRWTGTGWAENLPTPQVEPGGTVPPPVIQPPPTPVDEYVTKDILPKVTEANRTRLYQEMFSLNYAAWEELRGNKIKFRKFGA